MIANKKQLIINTQRASNHFGCPLRMLIKPLIMSILLFLSIIYSSSIFAIEINISLSNTNEPIVGTRYIAIPVDVPHGQAQQQEATHHYVRAGQRETF